MRFSFMHCFFVSHNISLSIIRSGCNHCQPLTMGSSYYGSSDEDEVEDNTFFKAGAINNESQLADQMHAMFTWEGALQYPNPVGDAIHRKEHKFVESETVLVVLEPKIGASLATYKKLSVSFW